MEERRKEAQERDHCYVVGELAAVRPHTFRPSLSFPREPSLAEGMRGRWAGCNQIFTLLSSSMGWPPLDREQASGIPRKKRVESAKVASRRPRRRKNVVRTCCF